MTLERALRTPIVALATAVALLATQASGWAHRIVHAPGAALAAAHGPSHQGQQAHDAGADRRLPADLHHNPHHDPHPDQQHEEGSAECRLIDQASHADAAPAKTAALSMPRSRCVVVPPRGMPAARAATPEPYQARAPPSPLLA